MKPSSWPWWMVALLCSVAAMLLSAAAMWLQSPKAFGLLAIGLLVFLAVLWSNPAYRYWKAFSALLGMWFGCRIAPNLFLSAEWDEGQFGFLMTNEVSSVFDAFVGLVALALLIADFLKDGGHVLTSLHSLLYRESQTQQLTTGSQQQTRFGNISGGQNVFNVTNATPDAYSTGVPVHAELDIARGHIDSDNPDVALAFLEQLRVRVGSAMTAHERYRLAALSGRAYELKGDFAVAAKCFIEAKNHEPHERDAQQLEAVAYALLNDNAKALALTDALLAQYPDSTVGLALKIRLSPDSFSVEELEGLIPTHLREDAELLAALGQRCKKPLDSPKRESYFRRAIASLPDSHVLMEELASSIVAVEMLALETSGAALPVTGDAVTRLDEACALINKVFEKGDFSKQARAHRRLVRGLAHDLSGRYEQAETDYRAAREAAPNDQEIAHYYSQFLVRRDRIDDAIDALRAVASLPGALENAVNLAKLLHDRNQPGDSREAITVLAGGLAQATQEMGIEVLTDALSVLTHVYGDEQLHDSALDVLARPICEVLPRSVLDAMRADIFRRAGRAAEASAAGKSALAQLAEDAPQREQERVAKALTRAALHEEAVTVWKRIVQPTALTTAVRLALESAYKAPDDGFLIDLCKRLRENGIVEAMAIELEVVTLVKYHAYEEALVAIDAFLATNPHDKTARIARLNRAQIGLELERDELVERNPELLPTVEESEPHIGCIVARLLRLGPSPIVGAEYAYELLRANFNNPDVHKTFVGVVGVGEAMLPECGQVGETVEAGCAVQYRDHTTDEHKWVIIEDKPATNPMVGELPSSAPLAKEMIGKRVGDEFHLRRDPIQDRMATITAIANKYEYRALDVMDRWEDRFPEIFFVKKYSTRKEDSLEEQVKLIFKSIDLRFEFAKRIHEIYKSHPLSVTHFARLSNATVPEAMQHLASHKDLPIRCCSGDQAEWDAARKELSQESVLVLDLTALATIFLLGLHKHLQSFPFRVVVLRSARDVFTDLRRHEAVTLTSEGSITRLDDGRYAQIKDSPESKSQRIAALETFIAWIDSVAEIRSGIALATMPANTRKLLIDALGECAAEAIAVSSTEKAIFWTDDFAVAQVASSEVRIARVWTQVVFDWLASENRLTVDVLHEVAIYLVCIGLTFTRIGTDAVVRAATDASFDPEKQPLASFCRYFSDESVNPQGIVLLTASVLPLIWRAAPIPEQASLAAVGLLRALRQRRDGEAMLAALHKDVAKLFGVDPLNGDRCAQIVAEVIREGKDAGLILPGGGGKIVS